MIRYTTPTHIFNVNLDFTRVDVIYVTYNQNGTNLVEKTKKDLTITVDQITLTLSQEDTGKFVIGEPVEIQIRARFYDGTAVASNIMRTTVERVLKGGVI